MEIPLFPLGTVLFPEGLLPLRIFEQRYMEMSKACLKNDAPFGVCLIREGAEVGTPATPEDIGTLARIVQWDMQQLGVLQVVARGGARFRVLEQRVQADGLVVGRVEVLEDAEDTPVPDALVACRQLLERIAAEHGERLFAPPFRFDSSAWVSGRLAEVLPLPPAAKQALLAVDDGARRLEMLHRLIVREP